MWELGLIDPLPNTQSDEFEALMQRSSDCGLYRSIVWADRVPVRRIKVEQDSTETRFGPLTMVAVNDLLVDACDERFCANVLFDLHWPLDSQEQERFDEGEVISIRQMSGVDSSHKTMFLYQPPAKKVIVIIAANDGVPRNISSYNEMPDGEILEDGMPRPLVGKLNVTDSSGVRYQQVATAVDKLKAEAVDGICTHAFIKLRDCATLSAEEEANLEIEIGRGWKAEVGSEDTKPGSHSSDHRIETLAEASLHELGLCA